MNTYSHKTEGLVGPQQYDPFEVPDRVSDSVIDLRWLISTLWRRKRLLLFCVLVGLGLGAYNASQQVSVYQASASLLFEPERLQIVELADVLTDQDTTETLANQLQIINSTTLLERVIARLDVEAPVAEVDAIVETEEASELTAGAALNAVQEWIVARIPHINTFFSKYEIPIEIPVPAPPEEELQADVIDEPVMTEEEEMLLERKEALKTLRDSMSVWQISGSRVIEVTYYGPDPEYAALAANIVGEEYIAFQQELKNEDVTAVIDLMNNRISDLRQQLDASENLLEEARLELFERQPQSVDMTSTQLNALNEELAGIRLQLVAARARYERAASALSSDQELWSVSEFRDSSLIQELRRRELQLREESAGEAAITGQVTTPSKVVNAALIERLKQGIREEAGYIVEALEFEVSSLKSRETEMEGMIRDLEFVAIEQSVDALQTERLQREVQANQTLYQSFVDRLKEITEQANLQSADARFLSRAEAPSQPDRSRSLQSVVIAGAAGGALGLIIIMLLEKTNNAFRTAAELSRSTGLPVIGAVPQSGGSRNARNLAIKFGKQPRGLFGECIRNLRTSLLYAEPGSPPKVVMFSSSVPSEGKTSTVLLVGISSQQAGKKTVVVSCDLRDRSNAQLYASLSKDRRDKPKIGLVSVLRGQCSLQDALRIEPKSGLSFLAVHQAEQLDESPADLLALPRFAELIAELRERFDLVILDTPPALAVTDARLMARQADTIVYLVRWNKTPRNAVLEGLRELRSMHVKISGCAFTRVSERGAAQYSDNEFLNRRTYAAYYR